MASCKKLFLCVYVIDVNCFDKCFLLHVITGNIIFYKSLTLLWDLSTTILFRSLKPVFWKKSNLHNNSAVLLPKFLIKFDSLFYGNGFHTLYVFDCSTLFFINECFWKTQNLSESMFSMQQNFINILVFIYGEFL